MSIISITGFLTFLSTSVFFFGYISNNSLFPEPLSLEEEKKYVEMFENGNIEAKNILIEKNLRLVAHIAKKYSNNNNLDDLISIGTIGLIKGINSFNSSKGVKLSTYVSRCIDNEILMYMRSTKKLNSEIFLNEPIGRDKDDNIVTLQEILENNEKNIEDSVDLKLKINLLKEKMNTILTDREKYILNMRFGLLGTKPQTQNQIANHLGISRSYVSRIETKAIEKLNEEFTQQFFR